MAAAAAFDPDRLVLVGTGFGSELAGPYPWVTIVDRSGATRRVRCYGMEATVEFADDANSGAPPLTWGPTRSSA